MNEYESEMSRPRGASKVEQESQIPSQEKTQQQPQPQPQSQQQSLQQPQSSPYYSAENQSRLVEGSQPGMFLYQNLNVSPMRKNQEPASGKAGIMQKNFIWFGIVTAIYACLFTFCLYKNPSGATVILFAVATLLYYRSCMKKMEAPIKRSGIFYEAAIVALSFATCITADGRIIAMNYLGMFILTVSLMIHYFYADEKWDIPQYIGNFVISLCESILCLAQPFNDFNYIIKSNQKLKNTKIQYIFTGALISVPLIIVILMLLGSADLVFASTLESMWKNITIPGNLIGIVIMTMVGFFSAYSFVAFLAKERPEYSKTVRKQGEPIIAITFNSLIAIIYIIFCSIQVVYLFMGNMQLPNDYTYAQYAREGFFQLVAVCILNLGLVLFCIYYYSNHKLLKVILTVISLCTYVMIASSAFRMLLYISEYRLTFLRIFVLWALVVITLLMTGVIIYIIKSEFNLLKYAITAVTIMYIILSFSHPDYFIAKYNYSNADLVIKQEVVDNEAFARYDSRDIDDIYNIDSKIEFMSELCADAAPAILDYAKRLNQEKGKDISKAQEQELYNYFNRIYNNGDKMNIRTFNYSEYTGKVAAADYIENY